MTTTHLVLVNCVTFAQYQCSYGGSVHFLNEHELGAKVKNW